MGSNGVCPNCLLSMLHLEPYKVNQGKALSSLSIEPVHLYLPITIYRVKHREAKKDQEAAAKRQAEEHELECQGVKRGEVVFFKSSNGGLINRDIMSE